MKNNVLYYSVAPTTYLTPFTVYSLVPGASPTINPFIVRHRLCFLLLSVLKIP